MAALSVAVWPRLVVSLSYLVSHSAARGRRTMPLTLLPSSRVPVIAFRAAGVSTARSAVFKMPYSGVRSGVTRFAVFRMARRYGMR